MQQNFLVQQEIHRQPLRIAATGHRPEKLGGYTTRARRQLELFAVKNLQELENVEVVYTGMALGWDQAIAAACKELSIPFEACIPFAGQENPWQDWCKDYYRHLLQFARVVHVVSTGNYQPWKMHRRDRFMVDRANLVLAMWNGDKQGGTFGTIQYAITKNVPVKNLYRHYGELPLAAISHAQNQTQEIPQAPEAQSF